MSMPATAIRKGQGNQPAPFVVIPHDHGYTVYRADAPNDAQQVSGSPDNPSCSCPDFQSHPVQDRYRCHHIYAVFQNVGSTRSAPLAESPATGNWELGASDLLAGIGMVLKRSVSPDRRIDSLSVEFTIPPEVLDSRDIDEVAMAVLSRQDAIVTAFLDSRKPSDGPESVPQAGSANSHGVPAMLRDVGGMQTRWGWRYFINVAIGDKVYKLFGTRKQLAEQLMAAGCAAYANNVTKGASLNAACLAVLAPSEDGKYVNVESILPLSHAGGNGR